MAFYAKKARGLFARYMADNKIEKIDELKMFTAAHYAYDDHLSSEKELVFTR